MPNKPADLQKFMDKVKKLEKGHNLDLSSDEDLSIGVMNLISMEEHLFFTYGKTKDAKYLTLLNEIREMRKTLLKRIIKDYEGEVWCISKHLLAASMRIMEVGTKALTKGDKVGAQDLFNKSYDLYSLFWGLNLGVIDAESASKLQANHQEQTTAVLLDEKSPPQVQARTSVFAKLGSLVKHAIDCCRE